MPTPEAAEERWRLTLDRAPVGISLVDLQGRFRRANDLLCELVGFTREQLLTMTVDELTHPDDLAADLEQTRRLLAGEITSFRMRKRYMHARGHDVWVDLSVAAVLGPDGRPRHTVGYVLDLSDEMAAVAEVGRVNGQLSEKTARLEQSNADLEAFAMLASHDLQAPLATVVGYLQLLESEHAHRLGDEAAHWISRASSAAQRMSRLVESLLTISISDRAVVRVPVSVSDLVMDVCADLDPLIQEHGAVVEVTDESGPVWADPERLRQVLQNLVHNALKYRHPDRDPHVVVHVDVEDPGSRSPGWSHGWVVTVDDNALGVPPDRREQVFGLFERLEDRAGAREVGHGIGLAACRRIVERHGGRIWVEDGPDGVGTRVAFTLRR